MMIDQGQRIRAKLGSPMSRSLQIDQKQREFNAAMEAYERRPVYRWIGHAVAFTNVTLQAYLFVLSLGNPIEPLQHGFALLVAFILADFINGLVHMIMDGNAHYASFVGPLIASFHLHHKTPAYKRNPLPLVYFNESGAKVWLACLLILTSVLHQLWPLPPVLLAVLAYFAVFSSVAEVSHYLCHTPQAKGFQWLVNAGILLGKKHHAVHHSSDNKNYAFLNGMTDPLLNLIAAKFLPGYKQNTDLHYAEYTGKGTANRG